MSAGADLGRRLRDGDLAAAPAVLNLVESRRKADDVADLLREVSPAVLGAEPAGHLIGVTGPPGAGKSSLLSALVRTWRGDGRTVAVLAVDPSSKRSGGSLLGDRARIEFDPEDRGVLIRSTAAGGRLGGLAPATRAAAQALSCAYDVVVIETVGVGQSETAVAGMVDHFLLLMLARAGDSLQGIKRGVLELADVIAVNKADGEHVREARAAARELADVMRMLQPHGATWTPPVLTCSAIEDRGVAEVWDAIGEHRAALEAAGDLAARRAEQEVAWLRRMVRDGLEARLTDDPAVAAVVAEQEALVRQGATTAALAAGRILESLRD